MEHQSQSCQDEYVEAVLNGKRGGYWLELGGNDAKNISNTYYLEKALGWSGITVEYERKHAESYRANDRRNTHLMIADATLVKYPKVFEAAGDAPPLGGVVDYLQIDLEPKNGSTWAALKLIERDMMPVYRFAAITFEHDCYTCPSEKLREPARKLFKQHGYVLVFPDVVCYANKKAFVFEDWYVHPSAVDAAGLAALMAEQPSMPRVTENVMPITIKYGLDAKECVKLAKKHFCK